MPAAHARKTPVRDVAFQRLREGWEFEDSTWCALWPGRVNVARQRDKAVVCP